MHCSKGYSIIERLNFNIFFMKNTQGNMIPFDIYFPRNTKSIYQKYFFTLLQVKIKCSLFSTSVSHVLQIFVISCFYLLKADMRSYILLQTAAIFFLSSLYLKQGIGSVNVIIDFICKGYLELSRMRVERELQNEKCWPTVGFEPGTFFKKFTCSIWYVAK